jgi:hypothetical protein
MKQDRARAQEGHMTGRVSVRRVVVLAGIAGLIIAVRQKPEKQYQ